MDFNLVISAQTLRLAPELQLNNSDSGTTVVKNVTAKSYLRVTSGQWTVLRQFERPQNVPTVLDAAIRDRFCLPLGEFFELVLKAVQAQILLSEGQNPPKIKAANWGCEVRPKTIAPAILVLFFVGLVMSFGFRPDLPSTALGVVVGLAILVAARSLAALLAGCVIRGAGGEVYQPRWNWFQFPPAFAIDDSDIVMLPRRAQDVVLMVEPAMLATATGIATWYRPEWGFLPLVGLILNLRPIFGGRVASVVRLGNAVPLSDAEHSFIFPPNRGPKARWCALGRTVRQGNTWLTIVYGIAWTLAVVYLGARLTDTPPWSIQFWQANGIRVAAAIGGSLGLLALIYSAGEMYLLCSDKINDWRFAYREWHRRWFGGKRMHLDDVARLEAITNSPLLRQLNPPQRQQLIKSMQVARFGPWRTLPVFHGRPPPEVGLIVSGRVALRRQLASGRRVRTIVFEAGDLLGVHDCADPESGVYDLRTMTPTTVLTVPRATAAEIFLGQMPAPTIANFCLKLPFLRSVSLCANWHLQAVERFAVVSSVIAYPRGRQIFLEATFPDRFFIIFEGEATVSRDGRPLGIVRAGEFFGEIGMMQMSAANATITARDEVRCLAISRQDFMRFVTHNYTVALELERVSSKRLGRPLFPLKPGDFRGL